MPKNYRTAQGKTVDMAALVTKNEKVRAVGNMKVNARGDTIDSFGKILIPVTQKVGESYQKTVGNKSAQVKKPVLQSTTNKAAPKVDKEELTIEEKILEESFEDDIEVEKIKAQENKG